jgi:hypothetical protein
LLLLSMLALCGSRSARAAEPAVQNQAIELGRAALDAYARGAWDEAHAAFRAAENLAHSPVFVLYMARCSRNSGRLLEARELLRKVAAEQLPADAPAPWLQAVVTAHSELGSLQQLIPSVVVRTVHGPPETRGAIDGRPAIFSEQEREFELDPGQHALVAGTLRRTVQLVEGRRRVPLILDLAAPAPHGPPGPASPATAVNPAAVFGRQDVLASEPDRGMPAPRVLGFALLGAGTAALVAGIATGLIAKQKTDEVKAQCRPRCPREVAAEAELASDWAGVATVSFIVAGTGLASGGALLLLVPSEDHGTRLAIAGRF